MSDKPKRKQGGKGRPWPKGVSENPSGKPSRLTKMGEEFMREDVQSRGARFCPWSQILLIVIFWGPNWGFRSAGNARLYNALADHETNKAAANNSK